MEKEVQVKSPSKKQGRVYMFLQRDFQEYDPRKEEDIKADIENITKCFNNLGFDVDKPRKYYTKEKIKETLIEAYNSKIWHQYESIFIFFVTHSSEDGKLLCEDGSFYDEEMIRILIVDEYPDLLKVFIFQASQATKTPGTLPEIESDGSEFRFGVPAEANFFVIKSSFEREAPPPLEEGSYFLKVFCQNLENIGNGSSLFNIMTAVLCELKAKRIAVAKKPRNNKLPEISSTLLKPMYFHSKGNSTFELSRYEETFSFGKQTVFNFAFPNNLPHSARPETEVDVRAIKNCFPNIGFKVEVYNDLTADEVRKTIDKGTNCKNPCVKIPEQCGPRHHQYDPPDYSKDTCVAVSIMTHGCHDGYHQYFGTLTENMKIADVINRLIITDAKEDREDLSGKPKLFFLQMCRDQEGDEMTNLPLMNLPLEFDDMLVFHSTYLGNKSYRLADGTPFFQKLCEKINQIPDGVSVSLTDVLHEVQESVVRKLGQMQMPIIYSTLTKHIFIRKH